MTRKILGLIVLLIQTTLAYTQNLKSDLDFIHSGQLKAGNNKAVLPIEIWNDLILVKAKFNNIEGVFIWDNGAYISILDSAYISKTKIKASNKTVEAKDGNNNTIKLNQFLCNSFKIGKIEISNTPISQVQVSDLIQTEQKTINGLIGASIINKLNWNFDFDKNLVEVSTKSFLIKNAKKLPFNITASNKHLFDIKINGYETQTLSDFGYNGDDIRINIQGSSLFQNNKASEEYGITSFSISGASNIDTTYIIKSNYTFSLAKNTFDFLPKISLSKNNENISIGNRFFRDRFNVAINCVNDTSYLLVERKHKSTILDDKSFGLKLLLANNHFYIAKLTTNENVKDKGLQLFDEIIEINNKKTTDFKDNFDLIQFQKELLESDRTLTILTKKGEIFSFKPKIDYEQ